jgi:hypothetical protein
LCASVKVDSDGSGEVAEEEVEGRAAVDEAGREGAVSFERMLEGRVRFLNIVC